ncbi:hypothetical protein BOX15_Mlig016388g2 [Macrostomum lignano]|uniref:AAA+ ATPase domain-containing protein n=1 Tax=Macrostomum lignano TaxID=282301 RepID=A0A267DFW1_9PLAT|nr:hypothetical protein BOX15_Mlig016388g2 [Macrostomum lignano]
MRLQFKRNNQQRLSIDLIVACLAASVEEWDAQVKNLMSDDATVHTVETFFGNLSKSPTELAEEFRCFQCGWDQDTWMEYLRKILFALRMSSYSKTASAIIKVSEKFGMTGELQMLKRVLQMGERSLDTPLRSIETAHIEQFDYLEEVSKDENFVPLMDAISKSYDFCMWVRTNVQRQDLKTFFDLAMIYLGDSGDMEQKKIETFNQVVSEFDGIIYDLGEAREQQSATVVGLLRLCGEVLAKVKTNQTLIKDLTDTSARLDWIKAVKENQGSVEKSTIKKIEAIVATGFIYLGCQVDRKEPFLMKATSASETDPDNHEVMEFDLDDVKDLQSKLMLIAGQSYENRDLLDRFINLTASIFRLIEVYKEFNLHCCVLCEKVFMKFNLKTGRKNNASIELRYCNPPKSIRYSYSNITAGLTDLSNVFQDCLNEWKEIIQRVRVSYHSLNFFNLRQIRILQTDLAPLFCTADATDEVGSVLLHLLGYLSPNCTIEDINRSVDEVVVERAQGSRKQAQSDDTHSIITEHLRDEGFSEDIIKQTARILFRNTDLDDLPTVEELQAQATDLAYKVERNTVTQADKQPRKEWKTADQELIAAEVGNLSAHDAFSRLWKIYIKNIDTSHKDFLSFKDVALFLNHIGSQRSSHRSQRKLRKSFRDHFPPGKPMSLTLEPSEQLLVALHLFQQAYDSLPHFEEVLICSEETNEEEITVFLHRAILDQSPNSLYVIMNADKLTYDLSVVAEENFSALLDRVNSRTNSYLFALSSSESQKQYPFCNALSLFQKDLPTKPNQKKITDWVAQFMIREAGPAHSSFLWITSNRSGMGKSHQCNEIAKVRSRKVPHVFSCSDSHLDVDKLYNFFAKAEDEDRRPQTFHLDIAREVQTGFENVFTQLAMFGAITDSSGRIWRRRREDLYLLEHSRNYLFKTEFFVLRYLPSITCVSPSDALRQLEAGEMASDWQPLISDSRLQSAVCKRPAVYLASLGNRNAAHCDLEAQIPSIEIVRLLLENCGIDNPSWLELNNFARFFNGQLVDFERSPFCGPLAEQDLPGFRRFVLSCLLLMSKDFSSRSLNIADESEAAQPNAENDRPLIENFEVRRRWEHTSHPYLLFNQDGTTFTFVGFTVSQQGHLLDSATNAVVQEGIMSPQLYQSLIAQRVRLQERFEDLSRQNKIERMRMVFGHSDTNFPDPDPSYELTMDNVKKMLAIYMRFRSEIPVVLMGETGCGKTKLVEFLARIMLPAQSDICNMRILKVHGAVTTADVVKAVQDAVELSRQNHAVTPYTILFFDEVNTTSAVGLIKEIMIDGRINGERISFAYGLRCIAACNPYRKHPESTIKRLENSGLGYRVRKEDTQDKFGNVPMRHLVYRVKPLPLSLISVLWDFGSLSDDSERKYITRMVESRLRTSPAQKARLVELVAASQHFMRNTDDETKYVSLREVEKVIVVFQWLSNGLLAQLDARDDGDSDCNEETLIEIMALASCYLSRLPKENKNGYLELLSQVLNAGLSPHDIMQIITQCHQRLLNDISEHLPKSIAKNEALRENVFMMVLCITLRIPLFVVGKPGSSKSLGKSIVKSNMLGTNSQGEIFRQLPNTQMLSFQCSPWSTSEGIIKTFEQCSQLQKEKDLDKFVSVVILDEVGLAEDSPKMPLKALHPLLEEGYFTDSLQTAQNRKHSKVGFIGISNWALDPAKMNRGLYLLRDVPTHEDLLDTAKGICQNQVRKERVRLHLEPVTKFYEKIYDHTQKEREFFGLRDYFSLVKHLASKSTLNLRTVAQCIKRNFSGFGDLDPVDFFAKEIVGREIDLGNYSAIRDALRSTGEEQRYLLLITENYSGFKILPRLLEDQEHDQQVSIIFGSSFPKDQDYSKICLDINRIKISMERGSTVVLLNMDALYESLYDVLNQYYEQCGDDRFVDLGLGTHRLKCKVNRNFRMIVVAEQTTVRERFPIPLINRLEKHKLTTSAVLVAEQQEFVSKLNSWVKSFYLQGQLAKGENPSNVFVGYHDDVISSLALEFGSDEEAVKRSILLVAPPDSLVRLNQTRLRDLKSDYLNEHYDRHCLQSIKAFLANYSFSKPFLQVTTFDRLLATRQVDELSRLIPGSVTSANLSKFESETQFMEFIRRFLSTDDMTTLILQFEGLRLNYQNLLACAKYLIEEQFKELAEKSPNVYQNKRVMLFIKLVRSHANPFTGFDSGTWQSVHIEELVPSGRVNIRLLDTMPVSAAVKLSYEAFPADANEFAMEIDQSLLLDRDLGIPIDLRLLIEQSLHQAMSMLRDGGDRDSNETDSRLMERQEILSGALRDDQSGGQKFFECMCKFVVNVLTWKDESSLAMYSPNEWLSREAARDLNVLNAGTFIESTWRVLRQKVAPAIACFLALSDRDQNLNCYRRDGLRGLWLRMVEPSSGLDQITENLVKGTTGDFQRIEVASSSCDGRRFACRFPFSWAVVERLERICNKEQQREAERLMELFLNSTPIGQVLQDEEAIPDLVGGFCHDLVRIRIAGVTEEMLQVLVPVMLRGLSGRAETCLGAAVFESFWLFKEFSQQMTLVTRLMKKVPGLALQVDRIDRLEELPEALFDAFYEYFETNKRDLNAAEKRAVWLNRVERAQSVIDSLLSNFGKPAMDSHWQRIVCVYLFLKNVTHRSMRVKRMERVLLSLFSYGLLWAKIRVPTSATYPDFDWLKTS